jgi:hypothetical protein
MKKDMLPADWRETLSNVILKEASKLRLRQEELNQLPQIAEGALSLSRKIEESYGEAEKLIGMLDACNMRNFFELRPIDGLTLLAVMALLDEKSQERARTMCGHARSENARAAAHARHRQPGGSVAKQHKIREIWASGKYKSRDKCAKDECDAIGMSFSTARKALRGMPEPKRADASRG